MSLAGRQVSMPAQLTSVHRLIGPQTCRGRQRPSLAGYRPAGRWWREYAAWHRVLHTAYGFGVVVSIWLRWLHIPLISISRLMSG